MRIRAPVFVVGFQRGGTNILTNLLASHPELQPLDRETHQLFYGRRSEPLGRWAARLAYLPVLLAARRHVFRPAWLGERPPLPRPAMAYVDLLLARGARRAARRERAAPGPGPRPPANGVRRLLCKNVNGLAMATPMLAAIYPDASFVALVRNGLALCEGYLRRGWSAEAFGRTFAAVAGRMLDDAARRPGYRLVRFEELIAAPVETARRLHRELGLDPTTVRRYRLQAKPSMGRDGRREYTFGGEVDREIRWFAPDEVARCFRLDVDRNQIGRLAATDRAAFLRAAGPVMERLGYLERR